jgi:hypothetical protein
MDVSPNALFYKNDFEKKLELNFFCYDPPRPDINIIHVDDIENRTMIPLSKYCFTRLRLLDEPLEPIKVIAEEEERPLSLQPNCIFYIYKSTFLF